MARISVERAHDLGLEVAREKAQKLVEKLTERYGLAATWVGDGVKLERPGINGEVEVGTTSVKVTVELGMLMSAMCGPIKAEIEKALDKALA